MKKLLCILFSAALVLPVMAVSKDVAAIIPKSQFTNVELEQQITGYARDLGTSIKNNWFPRDYNGKYRTLVRVSSSEAYQFNTMVSEGSGDSSFDQSALVAVQRSLPANSRISNMTVEYLFQYKNIKRNWFSNIPIFGNLWRIPAKIGAGYVANKLGLNEVVVISI